MTRYTVVWVEIAQSELADLWIAGPHRDAITAAANAIDRELGVDAASKGDQFARGDEDQLHVDGIGKGFGSDR